MKFKKEFWIGLMAAVTLIAFIWGFKFLKGNNLLLRSHHYFVVYDNVDQLSVSAPILLNGYQIGTVDKISINEENYDQIIVKLHIEHDIKIHQETRANIISEGIMGGKAIELDIPAPCAGDECADSGDYLKGELKGLLSSFLSSDDLEGYFQTIKAGVAGLVDTLSDQVNDSTNAGLYSALQDIKMTLENVRTITSEVADIMDRSSGDITATMNNLNRITSSLADNQEKIESTITNLNEITGTLAEADIKGTIGATNEFINTANEDLVKLSESLDKVNSAMDGLSITIKSINEGEGSLGQLIHDKGLYENMERTTLNLNLLLQDMRLNPKRYVNFSLFGKNKDYLPPEEDPAYNDQ